MSENTMSRRDLMKWLGVAAGTAMMGGAMLASGCSGPKKAADGAADDGGQAPKTDQDKKASATKRLVFYFTGTGNSLYVARQLSQDAVSIPQVIHRDDLTFEAEEIGIVYPLYGHMPPNMVREFIQKAKLKCDYLFAVITYGHSTCNASEILSQIGSAAGHTFNYIASVSMVDNWLPKFDMEEEKKLERKVDEDLARIVAEVDARKNVIEPVTDEDRAQHEAFLKVAGPTFAADGIHAKSEEWFTVTDKCVTCGDCVRVCPRNNYKIEIEKAVPTGRCELCLACIHACHHKAITIASGEKNPNARYRHPMVKPRDISAANSQLKNDPGKRPHGHKS